MCGISEDQKNKLLDGGSNFINLVADADVEILVPA